MQIRRSNPILAAILIAGVLLSLFLEPMLLLPVAFLIYWAGELVGGTTPGRVRRIVLACAGSIGIAIIYLVALRLLDSWERTKFQDHIDRCVRSGAEVCPAAYPIFDPTPPPPYWEWAAGGSFILLIVLYTMLFGWRARSASVASSCPVIGGEQRNP